MNKKDDTQNSQKSEQDNRSGFEKLFDRFSKNKKDDDSLPPIGTIYGLLNDDLFNGILMDAYLDKWQKKKKEEKEKREKKGETE